VASSASIAYETRVARASDRSPDSAFLCDEGELPNPSFAQPRAPEAVGGHQLVECLAADLRRDVRRVGGERVDQGIRHGMVGLAVVLLLVPCLAPVEFVHKAWLVLHNARHSCDTVRTDNGQKRDIPK
jgi:hypothetical protein